MIDKVKLKGPLGRPLSLTNPLMTLSPVTGAGNRVHRAEEATAPAEAQTLLLLSPSAESTSPAVVLPPQAVPVILPLDLIPDKPTADLQSTGLPALGPLPPFTPSTPQPPLSGGLSSHGQAINPPDKGGQGPGETFSELHRALAELHRALSEQHRDFSEPLAPRALTSETQQRPYEVAFQTGPDILNLLDLNRDAIINPQDAQVLYYLTLDPTNLTTLLTNLNVSDPTTLMNLNLLNPSTPPALDLNNDDVINLLDVRVLYYALRFGDILRASASLRETLLGDLTVADEGLAADRRDAVYIDMLERVADLFPVITTGDGAFEVDEGGSYDLSTVDLSARDLDDATVALIWRLTIPPTSGQLKLSTGTAITRFTQAQLAAGKVVYVHDDSNTLSDGFTLQVEDDEGLQTADPVIVSVEVTRKLDSIDLSELSVADGFIIQGDRAGDYAGGSVSGAGDVNGDGYADFIIGANLHDDGGTNAGQAYVVFGRAADSGDTSPRVIDLTSPGAEDGFIIRGDAEDDYAGVSVSGAGDVNGDGFADLIVGADGADEGGEAYVVFGRAADSGDTSPRVIDLTSLGAEDGFIIRGDTEYDYAGVSVSGAGDVNGDGYADLIVGANFDDDGGNYAGQAYVIFGKQDDFGDDVSSPLEDGMTMVIRRVIELESLAVGDGFIIQGDAEYDYAGGSVSAAGDVNGDGYADLIVGADGGNDSGDYAGEAYVIFGKQDDFGDEVSNTLEGGMTTVIRRVVDLTELAVGDGFIIQGDGANDQAGFSVSSAGDVNGDGFADLIVGANFGDDGGEEAGEAYVVFGKAPDPSDPPSNPFGNPVTTGEGESAVTRQVIDLTELTPEDGFIIQGDTEGDRAGRSVSGAGDVNGDGYADLIVGAPRNDDGGSNAGKAYLIFGKAPDPSDPLSNPFGGPVTTGEGESAVTRQVIDLVGLAPEDGFVIQGDAPDDNAGVSVSAAGDVNGDGFADLIVGAYRADVIKSVGGSSITLENAGEAYILFGGPAGLSTEAAAVLGTDGDDDLNADGQATVVLAGAGDDVLNIDGFGAADLLSFDGGSGTDTLRLNGVGLSLDLSTLADTRLSSIERIDINGGGASGPGGSMSNRLSLSRQDLLNLSEVRTEGRAELRVDGNVGDRVTISSDWMEASTQEIGDVMYNVFDNGNARLLVNIAVDVAVGGVPTTGGDGTFRVFEGTIYTLTPDDLSARDPDNDAATLTWTVTTAPTNGRLALSTTPDVPISPGMSFTQAQLEAGEVVYVPTGGGGSDDGFVVRVADDRGNQADPVTVNIAITGLLGNIDLTELTVADGFIIQGDAVGDFAGRSVSGAGDVNGDGFADLIVGAPFGDAGGSSAGEAYVVFGKASNPRVVDLTNLAAGDGFIIRGDATLDAAGGSVSGAGDVNGDGFADLIVGAPFGDDGGPNAGEAYVVFGKASDSGSPGGGRRVVELESLAAGDGFIIQGDTDGNQAGISVSGAGDVNGDGFADLIVGANRADVTTPDGNTRTGAGEAYVVFGKTSNPRVVDLTNLGAGDGFIIQGDANDDNAGVSVSGAGDVNGDGFADFIVGASGGDDGGSGAGEAYLVFGKASPDSTDRRLVDLTNLGAGDGFIIQGDADDDNAGMRVSGAGDVNGDGYADLLVGASSADVNTPGVARADAGEAYLVFGKASDPSDPFGRADGTDRRVVDLASLAVGDGFIIQGDAFGDQAGVSVSGAGDVNGDGYADLLVGASGADVTTSDGTRADAGETYLVFGKASGFGNDVSNLLADGTSVVRRIVGLESLAPADGLIIQGDAPDDQAGVSVSGAGDVNGDGYADLLVGASGADVTTSDGTRADAGEAYVLFGGPAGLSTETAAELGTDGNDVLNVDGEATVVLAGAGDDVLNIDGFGDSDLLSFDGGTGTDTLRLVNPSAGTGLSLDLSTLADTRLSSIERIDLSGGGPSGSMNNNSLSLTRLDLLNLSEVRIDGRAQLRVDGNAGDRISTDDDGWVRRGTEEIADTTYRVFDNGNARLLVNIAIDISGIRISSVDLTALAPVDGFIIQGDAGGDEAGVSVSGAGDVNGDGFADLIVGARQGDDGGSYAGEAYLVFGRASGPSGTDSTGRRVIDLTSLAAVDGFIIQGDARLDRAGISVSGAGDVNGDGFADLLVGAYRGDDGGGDAGEAYLVFGKSVDPSDPLSDPFGSPDDTGRRVIDLTSLAAEDGFIIQGDAGGNVAGISVSGAGDVNGDGYTDLLIGARGGEGGVGAAYLLFGKAASPSDLFGNEVINTVDDEGVFTRRVIDLTELAREDGFVIRGDEFRDRAGFSVSGAGDVNGDGYADLIVGAPSGDDGGSVAGEAYLVFGKASGPSDPFGSEVINTVDGEGAFPRQVIELAELAPEDGFIIQGDTSGGRAGVSVSAAGDVNGDGYADLIVGAPGGDADGRDTGEAYLVFGRAPDPSDPPSNPFGTPVTTREGGREITRQVIDLSILTAEEGFIIQGYRAGDQVGGSVSAAGDVNGDGYADLIVGARFGDVDTPDGTKTDAGEAYLVFGKMSGFGSPDPDTNRRVIDLQSLAPEDGLIIQGDKSGDSAGGSVSAAGDVNGDGYADLIVGAYLGDDGGGDAGEAYVLFGDPAGLSTEAAAVAGTDGDDLLNADGAATVVLAGAGDDVLNIDGFGDNDLLKFDGGSGIDTLRLVNPSAGTGLSLDLSTLADTRLSSIEHIDLSGTGANSLTLSRLDLLSLSEVRTEGRAELRVDGNVGDRIATADNGWVPRGREEIADVFYNVFDNGNARLLVNTAIDISGIMLTVDLTELAPADGFIIQGDATGDQAGISVSGAGDVNGDGYADLIVGANRGIDGGPNSGEAYVVFGRADDFGGIDGTGRRVIDLTSLAAGDGFIIQGDTRDDRAGVSVSGAGDVNGDGYADLLVGAPFGGDGSADASEAYLIFGRADNFGGTDGTGRRVIDLTSLTATDGFIIRGDRDYDQAGYSVSGAGDVNGDGYADLLVGAPYGSDGDDYAGEAYLVFGRADDFGTPVTTREEGRDLTRRVIDLGRLAAGDGFIIQGDATYDYAGTSVSGAGDVNGDGYADLIVGAPFGADGGTDAGEAYVVFGKASDPSDPSSDLFGSAVETTLEDGTTVVTRQVIDLTELDPEDGFILRGDNDGDQAGRSVSGAGDVNGDGYIDLIVGAHFGSDGGTSAGEAYVVFGKASDPSDPPSNPFGSAVTTGEGESAITRQVLDLTELAREDGFIIQGDSDRDRAGRSVSAAGDVNGDGYADLLVGVLYGDDGGRNAGEAYVLFGKASGPSDSFGKPVTTGEGESAITRQVIDLTGLAAGDGFIIQGDTEDDQAGHSVSAAGDVNGDGYADLLVGAPYGDDGDSNAGEAYVLFGGPAGLSAEAAAILGTDDADVLNADGEATVVLAGAGDDVLNIDGFGDTDLLKFDGGTGTDTLSLNGAGLSLDLSTLADTRLSSIEHIDLSGEGDNSLILTRLDLLNLSEVRTNGRAELRVDGNTGDSVTAPDDGWARGADVMIEGTMYRAFDNGNARLLVNMEVEPGGNLMATSMATLAEALQNCCVTQTVDIRALIDALPPEDEAQQRKRMEDELAMLGPLPAAKAAMELAESTAVVDPDADLFDLPTLIPDDG